MGRHSIDIPNPVITTETFYPGDFQSDEIGVRVEVGGVEIMERIYTRSYSSNPDPYPYAMDSEDAEEQAIAAFGKNLKTLFERNGLS